MNLLAIVGSPRKGKSTDTLVDKAIEGALSQRPDLTVKKIFLADQNIHYCRNCLTCRDTKTDEPFARCTIRDDMDAINPDIVDSDYLIFGTPLHMGYCTALMMTFLERICWTFAKPEGRVFTLYGCPIPRSGKERRSITIITNSLVPPIYRHFCDDASKLIKVTAKDSLNTKTVGDLYAGAIEQKGVECYFDKAVKLGAKLVKNSSVRCSERFFDENLEIKQHFQNSYDNN